MSEPTYRVELDNDPTEIEPCRWHGKIYRVSDGEQVQSTWGSTLEEAFDAAQTWARAALEEADPSRTVYLTEDGDILDPHEVQR